ncbi:porin [Burkholderia glumae]|uniref:porin n=1 Tax=Burkholderia glumae TaxID=337 RepID=UPI002151EA3E|nr:porin [Burkholderia glumae]UVS98884.1 porin [Burkholderia glumae]
MNKPLLLAAVTVALAAPAFAQTSVALYGVIDEGLDYTNHAGVDGVNHGVYALASGYAQRSSWGLRGAEDLGGGLKAIFTLESGFDLNRGGLSNGGRLFGRQAFVGLTHAQYGALTLGRQYDSVVDYLAPLTAAGSWGGMLMSHPFDNDNADNTARANNSVKYASPGFGGLTFGGAYSFGNGTGFATNREYSAGAHYGFGGLQVGAAYLQADKPGRTADGAAAAGDINFVADRVRIFGGGVNYTFGEATVGLVYTKTDLQHPVATVYLPAGTLSGLGLTATRFDNFEVNGKYQLTPAFFLGAQYAYTSGIFDTADGAAKPHYHTLGLMADYSLSKQTDVYLQGAWQRVGGDRTGTAVDGGYLIGTDGPSASSSQFSVRAAIRHKF